QPEVRDFDPAFRVTPQFVISCECIVVVRGECPQLRRGRVFLPLLIRPRLFVDPLPPFADTKVEIAIESPTALRLFANLKPRIRTPLWQKLLRRPHLEVGSNER